MLWIKRVTCKVPVLVMRGYSIEITNNLDARIRLWKKSLMAAILSASASRNLATTKNSPKPPERTGRMCSNCAKLTANAFIWSTRTMSSAVCPIRSRYSQFHDVIISVAKDKIDKLVSGEKAKAAGMHGRPERLRKQSLHSECGQFPVFEWMSGLDRGLRVYLQKRIRREKLRNPARLVHNGPVWAGRRRMHHQIPVLRVSLRPKLGRKKLREGDSRLPTLFGHTGIWRRVRKRPRIRL